MSKELLDTLIEEIVTLYFKGYTVKEALEKVGKSNGK